MKAIQLLVILSALLMLSACQNMISKQLEWETIEPESYPTIRSVGYAPIDAQQGETRSAKVLNALKASKLDAYRELTEQVYGQKIDGGQSLANLVLTDTQLKATVQGVIRGARVVKSYPVGEDSYATELELDFALVHDIYLSTAKPKKLKKIRYY
ncbi:flagellar biosynthesis protein FlgP [Aliiglaciecola litoralis]|uniref:LPP20 family lipoprotein n=1 Tax=Aliiglaciecola litoralis TaxID=582857 RepID=A0ABN1LK58_9ALTE